MRRTVTDPLPTSSLELRSLVTEQGTLELSLIDVPLPSLDSGEILVRVEAAPINPSDLGLLLAGADLASASIDGHIRSPCRHGAYSPTGRFASCPAASASRCPWATREQAPL